MASSSSSRKPKYDVFLSFRGEDTRPNILSHLRDRLDDERIDTFKDDTGMERGEKIGPSLLEAIGSATIALIIVSKGYASSKWCLDELVEIMKRRDRGELIVLPIFDHVDPSDVRNPTTGIFADDFTRHEENYKEKAKLWRKAMAQVGKLSGYHLKNCRHEKNSEKEKLWRPDRAQVVFRSEAELLKEVIVDVRKKLKPTQSVCTNEFVGIDSQIEEVKRLLCLDKSDHIRVIGIVGMGGIGKTTIADVTFKQIRSDFESSIFLCVADVLTVSGRTGLAEAFLSGLLGKKVSFSSPCVSNSLDASWLCRKKILVVLDDVNNSKQLEDLIGQNGSSVFGQGSRIIVTSRDKQLLRTICSDGDDSISHVKGLYDDHALQLFCQNAFKQNYPKEDFRDMVWPLLQYADGNPLALKVLGSHLFMKPKSVWESVLNGLNKCQNQDIHNVLRISYDGLDKNQKKIFLHIGCFFADYAEPSRVIEVLDSCGLQTRYGLDVLMDKCLLDVRHPPHCDRGFVSMHSLLREMGREIVREESDDPGKRSILWDSSDIYQVFNKNSGTEAIQGINLGWTEEDVYLNSDAFKKMPNLKFLIFSHANRVHCPSMGLEYLPDELRLLRWDGCPLKRLPINFQPTNLVELSLRWSNLEQLWEGIQDLKKLSGIDLECSKCLIELADLSLAPNLVEIHLSGCRSLVEIPSSMNHLNKLEVLDLGGCTNIRSLPSPIAWRSLVTLCLWGCSELSSFPEIECLDALRELGMSDCITLKSLPDLSLAPNLVEIHLSGCRSLVEIASSMNHLNKLEVLDLGGCTNIRSLPSPIAWRSLVTLCLWGCSELSSFPEIECLDALRQLDMSDCITLKSLPDLSLAPNLVEIHLSGCRSLVEIPSSMNHLNKLEVLDLGGCTNIRSLPSPIAWRSLVTLCLWGCSELSSFPEIECLDALRELGMSDCITLKSLPDLSLAPNLVEIHLSGCRSLVEIASSMNHLNKLEVLDLGGCTNIRSLPSPIPWRSLGTLCLWGCSELSSFPEIECLDALRQLDMLDCITLKSLPDLSLASNLVEIDLSGCRSLVEIPSSMNHLNKLEYLSLGRCTNIRSLPSPIAWRSLETLCLRGCSELSSFPEIECLDALRKLDMSDCINVKRLSSSICRLKSLEELHLDGCSNLENFSKSTESPQSSGSQLHTNGQLSPLKHLSIKDCYKIRSFPELSGTVFGLKYLDLSHCKLLETVFDLEQLIRGFESEGSSRFFFCNCWKLDVQWSKIAALAKMKIQAEAIYSYLKGTYYEFKMIYPGSEIPKWIKYQNMGRSITIQLPVNKRFLGFALSAVVPAGDSFDCEFYFENTVVDSFSWKESGDSKLSLGSEHVILCYDTIGNDRYNEMVKKLGCRGGYYEVTFDISYCTCNIKRPDVLKCGLVPLYAQNVNYKRLETPLDESETTEVTINPTEDKFEVTINVTEDKFELSVDECQVKNLDQEHILRTYKDVGTEILEVDPLTLSSFCGTLFCVWGNERCKESKAVSTLCSPNEKCSICIDYEGDDECHAQNFDQEQQMFMDFRVQPNPAQAFTNNNRETCALSCSCDHVG